MSSTYSAESAASPSDLNERECEPSRSARSTHSAVASLQSTGRESQSLTTLPNSEAPTLGQLTLFAEDFPAKTFPSRARASALMGNAPAYGATMPDSLAKYDPASSLWRTSQLCLDGELAEFSETWPRSGMTRNGTLYPLPTLVLHTSESESGLWQTPVADDRVNRLAGKWNGRGEPKLSGQVKLWPTPAGPNDTGGVVGLGGGAGNRNKLYAMLGYEEGKKMMCGSLNPNWVEWLMGFPILWSALVPLETQSFQTSPNLSAEQS